MPTQMVLAYAPIERSTFDGDDRAAVINQDAIYPRDGEFRMQELHDGISEMMVTSNDGYDPSPMIRKRRRICVKLEILGDKIIFAKKKHALIKTLRYPQYTPLKAALICDEGPLRQNHDRLAAVVNCVLHSP